MAHSKLTPLVIEVLISELRTATRKRDKILSVGLSIRSSSVHSICEKSSISHTTFFRWLRASRALKGKRGRLTASEALLRKFGRAVEAYIAVHSSAKAVSEMLLLMLKPSRPSRRTPASTELLE